MNWLKSCCRWLWENWAKVVTVIMIVVAVVALQIATDAQTEAKESARKAKTTADALAAKVKSDAKKTLEGRIGSCRSSIDLRALLTRYKELVAPPGTDLNTLSPRQRAFVDEFTKATDKYVNYNPNCSLLTPEQRAQALAPR